VSEASPTIAQPLTARVRNLIESGRISIPPLPELVNRLQVLLDDEARTSAKRIADLIYSEPAVAATVLKLANSAAFGGLQRISDLSQAIARLGFRQVTSVITTLVHRGHVHSGDPLKAALLRTLWGHAVSTALASKHLAELTGADPEESYVAGLLHDTGKLLVLKGVDHLEKRGRNGHITPVVLDELMTLLHTELGHKILLSWHLPQPICEVALHHHDQDLEPTESLIVRVQAADAISQRIGEHLNPEPGLDLLELRSIEQMNLSEIELASLMVDIEDEIAEIKGLL
jgi:HD-like signal output (HDOD) protein